MNMFIIPRCYRMIDSYYNILLGDETYEINDIKGTYASLPEEDRKAIERAKKEIDKQFKIIASKFIMVIYTGGFRDEIHSLLPCINC